MRWVLSAAAGLTLVCACRGPTDAEVCTSAKVANAREAIEPCERAWDVAPDERIAVAGARVALRAGDPVAMARWVSRAAEDVEGARIWHFQGELQRERGDAAAAEVSYRHALALRIDRDPLRATNTAIDLLEIILSSAPAEESVRVARIAWQQATLSDNKLGRAFAAVDLIELLLDLGESHTPQLLLDTIDPTVSQALHDVAEGHIEAARGHAALAATLFARANDGSAGDPARFDDGALMLAEALVDAGQFADARRALDRRTADSDHQGVVDTDCRMASVEARLELADGHVDAALARVERGLAIRCRDRARAGLLAVQGDVLAKAEQAVAAEHAWRASADAIEAWRISLPSTRLRSGVIARHRGSLESWLDSAGGRSDASAAIEVAQRMLGRALLDRLLDREPETTASDDALIGDVLVRIADSRDAARHAESPHDLATTPLDLVAVLEGARGVWALRQTARVWSIHALGDRTEITALADAYRANLDDPAAASRLGAALFPASTLPRGDAPLVVLLDHELADLPLGGLRVDGRFLVERAPIVEVPAPELLFARMPDVAWSDPVVIGDPRGDLPGAAAEAALVGRALHVAPVVGSAATREVLLAGAHPRVLHLAMHSVIEAGRAALLLANGSVSSRDLLSSELAPRLAVVATCRSQGGEDPLTSLVATLLSRGTPGVIGAKRAIDDGDSVSLLRDFYASGADADPVRALAMAQRAAIARGRPAHAWATMSYFGRVDWSAATETATAHKESPR